jgi:hypothetical protein
MNGDALLLDFLNSPLSRNLADHAWRKKGLKTTSYAAQTDRDWRQEGEVMNGDALLLTFLVSPALAQRC